MEVLTLLKFTRTTPFFQKPSCKGQFAQLWPGNDVRRIAGWNRPRCVCFSFEVSFFFCFGTFLAVHSTPISQVLFQTSNAPTWVSRTQMQTRRIALKLNQSRRHTGSVHAECMRGDDLTYRHLSFKKLGFFAVRQTPDVREEYPSVAPGCTSSWQAQLENTMHERWRSSIVSQTWPNVRRSVCNKIVSLN